MTGRAAPMLFRDRVCVTCNTSFRPSRSDAETCSNSCRQAAWRQKKAKAEAEKVFAVEKQIAQNAHDTSALSEYYSDVAHHERHDEYRDSDPELRAVFKSVDFVGTPRGVLVFEHRPGAARLALACSYQLRGMTMTEHHSKDLEVLEALQMPAFNNSYIRAEHEKKYRDPKVMSAVDQRVLVFTGYSHTKFEPHNFPLEHLSPDDTWLVRVIKPGVVRSFKLGTQ